MPVVTRMSANGTFETCPPILRMSVRGGAGSRRDPVKPTQLTQSGHGLLRSSSLIRFGVSLKLQSGAIVESKANRIDLVNSFEQNGCSYVSIPNHLLTRHFLCFIQQFERLRTKLRRNAGGRANPRLRRPQDENPHSRVVELPILARWSRKNTYRHGWWCSAPLWSSSRAKLEDLWMVGISHLHPDHVSRFASISFVRAMRFARSHLRFSVRPATMQLPTLRLSSIGFLMRRPGHSLCLVRR